MQEAEIFLAPAPFGESYGLVLDEAMAAGTVPIAANNTGYGSVLAERPELLVEAGNVDALANAAVSLISDKSLLERHRYWARAKAQISNVSAVGDQFLEIYQSCLDGHS